MKTLSCLTLSFVLIFGSAVSQTTPNVKSRYALERLSDSGGLSSNETIIGMPKPPGELIGDFYYDPEFRTASVNIYGLNSVLKNIPIRYQIQTNQLELQYNAGQRVLDGSKVQSFVWNNSSGAPTYFINAKDFKFKGTSLIGFLEILVEDKVVLVKRKEVSIKKGNYVVALDAGTKDDEIIKKDKFYMIVKNDLIEIPKNKKEFLKLFPDHQSSLLEYFNKNTVSLKSENDLKLLFMQINSLMPDDK